MIQLLLAELRLDFYFWKNVIYYFSFHLSTTFSRFLGIVKKKEASDTLPSHIHYCTYYERAKKGGIRHLQIKKKNNLYSYIVYIVIELII